MAKIKLLYLKLIHQGINDFLLKGVQAPLFCAEHMMKGTPLGDAFK